MQKRMNQKGFSLVELVIVIAILAILGIAAFGFFQTSSNAYSRNSAEVNLQYESQLIQNQLDNLIIDTTKSMDYYYGSDEANRKAILCDDEIVGTVGYKGFHIKNEDAEYLIEWKIAQKKVVLKKYTPDGSGNMVLEGDPDGDLMAEYVADFGIDLTKAKDKRIVIFNFVFANGNKRYEAQHNITLRNRVPINGIKVDEYPDAKGFAKRVAIFHNTVDVTNEKILIEKSDAEQSLVLEAKVYGYNYPRQKVAWDILDADSSKVKLEPIGDNLCRVTFAAKYDTMVKVSAMAVDDKEKLVSDATAHTYIAFKGDGTPDFDADNENGFVRGGEIILQIDDSWFAKGAASVKWGFLAIQSYSDSGQVTVQTEKQARRYVLDEQGNRVLADAVWNDSRSIIIDKQKIDSEATKNNSDGYYKFNHGATREDATDQELFLVLDEADPRLKLGQCYIKCGKTFNDNDFTFGEHFGIQAAVKAEIYDKNGNYIGEQVFGSTAIDAEDKNPLNMKPMSMDIYDMNTGATVASFQTGGAGDHVHIKKGDVLKLKLVGHGWYQKPRISDIVYTNWKDGCVEPSDPSEWFNEETGEFTFKVADDYTETTQIRIDINFSNRELYWLMIDINF